MKTLLTAVAGLALASAAHGQWSDNFDSYSLGTINGQGGWEGWASDPVAAGVVTNTTFRSSPNSQQIAGVTDSVHQYSGVTTGQWSYRAWQFIPAGWAGDTYFILNNAYVNGGTGTQWAVQMRFQSTTGLVIDDNGRTENPINYVTGQWAEIRVDFDLTANTITEYYNGALLSSGTWTTPTGLRELQAVDLFANASPAVFYDDISLAPVGAACYANCDNSTTPPVLNVLDFNCFLNQFSAGASYANCDGSTTAPVLNVLDFNCFLNRFSAGCP
jgi:hypothetical protein